MMDFNEYQIEARRTQRTDLPLWALRNHALSGLSAEVGEVHGLHQKVYQGHPMDEAALRLEIGDCIWFLAELCDCYGWSLDDVAQANIHKLRVRYRDRFTVEESVDRSRERSRSRHYAKGDLLARMEDDGK